MALISAAVAGCGSRVAVRSRVSRSRAAFSALPAVWSGRVIITAVYQAGSSGRAGGTGTAAPRLRRAASTIIATAVSRIWPSSAAAASGSQVPAAMSWLRWPRQNVLSRSAMTASPSRAGVTPLSIQLAACGQVTSPLRVNPGPLTVISMPRCIADR